MRALLLADVCNPDWPSLPIVGYNYARAIADHADVHVVTQIRNQENIERDGLGSAEVTYLDTERVAAPIHKAAQILRRGDGGGWTIEMAMQYPSYLAFEWYAWRQFGDAIEAGEYDVVHRITPMSPTLPSFMAKRSTVPFVLGPLNGNLPWPPEFRAEQSREREWLASARNVSKVMPYYRSTYRHADAVLASFAHTIDDLPARVLPKTIDFPEIGIDPTRFAMPDRSPGERLTVVFAGRLVPLKLVDTLVEAFARSEVLRRHRLVIAGDGPERPNLERAIADHGLADSVQLLGQVPQQQVGELMGTSDIFAFPSIKELGAGVVVEAMACGLANVVVDYGGPGALIDDTSGVKIPLGDKETITSGMQTALEALVRDPASTAALGRRGHELAVERFSWDAKAQKTVEVYEWVLGRRGAKPDFWA